ncbi:signal peptidase I [Thermovenabulum gondwanense]|uniref:Signal peptidase I n=1 Tax=Thermovenabulum gondwanense TaxID=520767 RepID=A0A162N2E4_9FIRM|nr:signal peptidase I [Thermovenabulum gondwanense]KYO68701.1 Signal peptidase I T [Thermovenabulum gondwanense]
MENRLKNELMEWIKSIAIALVIALAIRAYIIEPMIVPTGSMIPTINIGDRILVNKYIYRIKPLQRGDIVVFKYPDDPSQTFVKRLIGLGGDVIEIKEGVLFINGKEYKEDYLNEPIVGNFGPYKVPEGYYFMMGDNRNNSKDSRFWVNKFVPKKYIVGKAVFRIWPLDRIGRIK